MSLLHALFGPSKDEIWSQIASEIGGQYIGAEFWDSGKLIYRHKQWSIRLDTTRRGGKNKTTYTRLVAPFINKDGLYFSISRANMLSDLVSKFVLNDIPIGDDYFDKNFVIKGNSPEKMKQLLASDNLKNLIIAQPNINVQIDRMNNFFSGVPKEIDQLYFECRGLVTDKLVLLNLFDIFCEILNRLVVIDSAYENDPNVRL